MRNSKNSRTFAAAKKKYRGVEQLVARQAHNLEVARSNPASATKREERGDETRKRGPIGSCFLVSFHLGQYFPVVPVGGLDAVLNTTVPKSDSLLDVVFGVIVLLDNQEHLF